MIKMILLRLTIFLLLVGQWHLEFGNCLRSDEMVKVGDSERMGKPAPQTQSWRTLVVYDRDTIPTSHSAFFDDLRLRGHRLTFTNHSAANVTIEKFGEKEYDNILLLAPTLDKLAPSKALRNASLEKFVDEHGGNILVVGGGASDASQSESPRKLAFSTGSAVRAFANSCGVEFHAQDSAVVDQLENEGGFLDGVRSARTANLSHVVTQPAEAPVYAGMGLSLVRGHPYTFPLLYGSPTTYSLKRDTGAVAAAGADVVLIAAMQARNNARVTFSGSLDFFSNDAFTKASANRLMSAEIAAWTYQQRGVLTWRDMTHSLAGESQPPEVYKTQDEFEFKIDLWHLANEFAGEWTPYIASDALVEYTMIDPHLRKTLKPPPVEGTSATHSVKMQTPEVPGTFKTVLHYKRQGWSTIHMETLTPSRNYRHDEYPRFLRVAFPYYIAVFAALFGFYGAALLILYHRPRPPSVVSADKKMS